MVPFCINADTGRKERVYLIIDKDAALANPQSYPGWCSALKSDKDCMLAAVHYNGSALWQASDDLRADREVVLAAVQQHSAALQYASKDLRADHEIVLAAVQQDGRVLRFADETLRQDERFVAKLADVCPLGIVWRYKPQVTLEGTARKAMRSKGGLRLLAKQARVSLLGNPCLMKEFLLSALEEDCLKDTLQTMIDSQKKGILDALRTIMAWHGAKLPDALPTDMDGLNAFCTTLSEALVPEN